ncbi:MAG TPA: hemolysin III family protein [Stenomitos sp.]
MKAETASTSTKPRLRGASHQAAFYAALGAGPMLVASTPTPQAAWTTAVYVVCLAALFGISALYHRPDWPPAMRQRMRRLDHSAIFLMIAGSYTPMLIFGLGLESGLSLLRWIWLGALAGIGKTLLWVRAPKVLNAALYLGFGWIAFAYLPAIGARGGPGVLCLLAAGGVIYSLGAVVYALRWPDPDPRTFGYHEIFHACVILAAFCHFLAILRLSRLVP